MVLWPNVFQAFRLMSSFSCAFHFAITTLSIGAHKLNELNSCTKTSLGTSISIPSASTWLQANISLHDRPAALHPSFLTLTGIKLYPDVESAHDSHHQTFHQSIGSEFPSQTHTSAANRGIPQLSGMERYHLAIFVRDTLSSWHYASHNHKPSWPVIANTGSNIRNYNISVTVPR